MALKVNRIVPGILAETRVTKFVGDDAVLKEFPPIYDTLHRNLRMPDYLSWDIVEPQWQLWDEPRELWLITAHRHKDEDLNNALAAFLIGLNCVPGSTHEEIGIHVHRNIYADLRVFGQHLLGEVSQQDLDLLTKNGSPPDVNDPNDEENRRIEALEAQAFQQCIGGWAQAISLYVRPEYRQHRIASHLLRMTKRGLVGNPKSGVGLFGKAHVSAEAFWAKVGARFYIGREIPDEEIFAITWASREDCAFLLDMFVRCPSHVPGSGLPLCDSFYGQSFE